MSICPVVLINVLHVEPDKQAALATLLRQNIENVVSTLEGWQRSQLIASTDGTRVIIVSEWASPAAVDAMREDPRMQACFPQIVEMARFDTTQGETIFSSERRDG